MQLVTQSFCTRHLRLQKSISLLLLFSVSVLEIMFGFAAILLVAPFLAEVHPHGLLFDPPARNWLWNEPSFPDQPVMSAPNGVWCGPPEGMGHPAAFWIPQDPSMSQCGRCGDDIAEPVPRDHEMGGTYGRGFIARTYPKGSVAEFKVRMRVPHGGYFYFELCANGIELDDCFIPLPIIGGNGEVRAHGMCVLETRNPAMEYTALVELPENVTCTRCTLRWTYRTAYFRKSKSAIKTRLKLDYDYFYFHRKGPVLQPETHSNI